MKIVTTLFLLFIIIIPIHTHAQVVGIRTNVLYGLSTFTPNIGVQTALSQKITFDISGGFNKWSLGSGDNYKKINHFLISAENRFWIYEKFDGHFLGVNTTFLSYNAGGIDIPVGMFSNLKENRYEGYGIGAGVSYGYQWYLGPHWNLEASVGVGYLYLNYDRFECSRCGAKLGHEKKHYVGPSKLGISLVYLIKSKKY